jgi:hypothetical protein
MRGDVNPPLSSRLEAAEYALIRDAFQPRGFQYCTVAKEPLSNATF